MLLLLLVVVIFDIGVFGGALVLMTGVFPALTAAKEEAAATGVLVAVPLSLERVDLIGVVVAVFAFVLGITFFLTGVPTEGETGSAALPVLPLVFPMAAFLPPTVAAAVDLVT